MIFTASIKKYSTVIVIFLLSVLFLTELTSAIQETQTIDEGTHLASGYSYLMQNDFRLNREHPPLLKELAALPLVVINNRLNWPFESDAWIARDQWAFAQEFLYDNTVSAETILLLGRLPTMLLSLLLGFFVFRWSKELFGIWGGLFSLTLFVFSPNIIAHSRYVTTDIGMATLFFITIYYFHKFLKQGDSKLFWLTAIFFSLAQAAKFSNIILLPILIILYLIAAKYREQLTKMVFSVKHFLIGVIIIGSLTFFVLLSVYGFQFTKPLDDVRIQQLYIEQAFILENDLLREQDSLTQKIISFADPTTTSGNAIKNFFENVPIPLFAYFDGFAQLYTHNHYGHTSYLNGEHTEFGWWYYFLVAFVVKTPVITLILLIILTSIGITWLWKKKRSNSNSHSFLSIPLAYYFLIIPPLFYLGISLGSNLNLGLRHIIVIYPFIFVILGFFVKHTIELKKQPNKYRLGLALLLYIASSVLIYPHYLAYFNELSGGPNNGPQYLTDSNIDWGQDVLHLQKYLSQNNIPHVCMAYFGQVKLEYFEIDYRYLPDNDNFSSTDELNCVVAISVTALLSKDGEYSWLNNFEPTEKIGYSLYIYDFRIK